MKNKIDLIRATTPEELVRKVNKIDKEVFATQPMKESSKKWVAFIYYKDNGLLENEKELATEKQKFFLKKAGINVKEDLTKQEAFQLIRNLKTKNI